jgi:hypothetical protein
MIRLSAVALTAVLALAGCASQRTMAPVARDTMAYSTELARAQQQQLLLNIVRLRYNDPVSFVEIETLSTEDTGEISGGLAGAFGVGPGEMVDMLNPAGTATRSVTPTVVYSNLRGGAYAEQLLQPVAPESIFLLSQSGWSVERLLLCCIARIGDLDNARAAAGPTPDMVPDNSGFRELAHLMRQLQVSGGLLVQVLDGEVPEQPKRVVVTWRAGNDAGNRLAAMMEAHRISVETLTEGDIFLAEISAVGRVAGTAPARGRSLLGILSALSQTVDVPPEHMALVGHTRGGAGAAAPSACAPADPWHEVMGDYFAVRWSREQPEGAAIAVPYRGVWFYVADTCRSSKSTIDLVGHLYALQAGLSDQGDGRTLLLLGN